MIFKSRYKIEFSKSKEIVLENIRNSIFGGSPNNFAKNFNGKVFENGFRVKVMGPTEPLTFKGSFVVNKNKQETLELSVGIRYLDIIIYLLTFCFFLSAIDKNYEENHGFIIVSLGLLVFAIISRYISSRKSKKIFFNYLKSFDKDYKIIPIK